MAAVLALVVAGLTSCTLDDRIDDLTGGYHGSLIDKETGEIVPTEYYGAKLRLLDLAYGDVAVPLDYNILPDGTYNNTKIFPSKYKIWSVGPFFEVDTIFGDIKSYKDMNLYVRPNVSLEIVDIQVENGITATVRVRYSVNDPTSLTNEIGIVYSTSTYPGYRTAMLESEPKATTYKRVKKDVTAQSGEFEEVFYLNTNTRYYFRAMGRTASAGDYWNYSKQVEVTTTSIKIEELPVVANTGTRSATSAVIQWSFPPIVEKIRLSYTDRDGAAVTDYFKAGAISYVANLPHESTIPIAVQLIGREAEGHEQTIEITTKALTEKYVEQDGVRPENVPFYNDKAVKMSISGEWALILGPRLGEDWTGDLRFEYIDWWNSWLIGFADRMPTCGDIEDIKVLHLQGNIHNLLDVLPFVNLEELYITVGQAFDLGLSIDADVDLSVLGKLKKLHTVHLGRGVVLDKSSFKAAGLDNIKVVTE